MEIFQTLVGLESSDENGCGSFMALLLMRQSAPSGSYALGAPYSSNPSWFKVWFGPANQCLKILHVHCLPGPLYVLNFLKIENKTCFFCCFFRPWVLFLHQLMTEPPAGLLVMLTSIHISLDDFKTWIKKICLLYKNLLVIALYMSDMMWVPSFPFYQSCEIESNLMQADIGVGPKQ